MAQYTSGGPSGSTTNVTAASENSFPVTTDQTNLTYTGPITAVNGQTFTPSATLIDTTTNTPVITGDSDLHRRLGSDGTDLRLPTQLQRCRAVPQPPHQPNDLGRLRHRVLWR